MKLKHFKTMAMVSAIALGVGLHAFKSDAATVLSGDPVANIPITGNVLNTLDIVATQLNFGRIAAIAKTADVAKATVAPFGVTLTDDAGAGVSTNARIAADSATPPAASTVTITGFANTPVFVSYGTVVDLNAGGAADIIIAHLTDNLGTGGGAFVGVVGDNGDWDNANPSYGTGVATDQGTATTNGSGVLTFSIGGTIATELGADLVYPNGTYVGSFDVTVSY